MIKYLHDRKHYEDRYDRSTVDGARWYEDNAEKSKTTKKHKEALKRATNMLIYFYTGRRWKDRTETINHWMERDRSYDDMMENSPAPKDMSCFMCNRPMELMDKFGHYGFDKEPHRIDFYFRCVECHVGIKIKDGVRERMIPWMCPKCKRRMKSESKKTKNEIRTRDWCEYCGYQKEDVFDLTPEKLEPVKIPDPKEEQRYQEDKLRFCLTDKEGFEYLDGVRRMEQLKEVMSDIHAREEARKERLKENPKGFAIEEVDYSCRMCHSPVPPFDNWYDKYGLKCMSCQHALERKTVPLKYFKDTDSWYPMWALKSEFGIHPQTAMKYVRQGKLKVYVIHGEDGSPTCYVFPKKETQASLKALQGNLKM